jgi:riboflavin-specific deaminase-like protein
VSVNFAITWDGRIATRAEAGVGFSSKADKRRLLEIRARADAVLVSARTAAADHMTMGMPIESLREERAARGQAPYPLRALLSNSGRIDPALPVFEKTFSPLHIFSTTRMPARTRAALIPHAELHLTEGKTVDLAAMLAFLRREKKVRHLHCEGGGRVFRSLVEHGFVDEIYLTLCPRVFGGIRTPTLTGAAADFLPQSTKATLKQMEVVGDECFLRYELVQK